MKPTIKSLTLTQEQSFIKPLLYIHVENLVAALKHYINRTESKILEHTKNHALLDFDSRCYLYLIEIESESI